MFLARVTGSVVSTQKVDAMVGQKLLVVEPLRVNEKDQSGLVSTGRTFICVDTVGAGDAFFSVASLAAAKRIPVDVATFLGQLAGRCVLCGLPGVDPTTWRVPHGRPRALRITATEEEHAVGGVNQHDSRR